MTEICACNIKSYACGGEASCPDIIALPHRPMQNTSRRAQGPGSSTAQKKNMPCRTMAKHSQHSIHTSSSLQQSRMHAPVVSVVLATKCLCFFPTRTAQRDLDMLNPGTQADLANTHTFILSLRLGRHVTDKEVLAQQSVKETVALVS